MLARQIILLFLLPLASAGGQDGKLRVMFTNDDGYLVWPLQHAFRYFMSALSDTYDCFISAVEVKENGKGAKHVPYSSCPNI